MSAERAAGWLRGQVAVVTGAGRGLGLAIAQGLADEGASLLLTGRSADRLASAQRELEARGAPVHRLALDLREPNAAPRIVEEAVRAFGRLDVLVNNAAVYVWRGFFELTEADFVEALETNVHAPFRLTQAAAKQMVAQGSGGAIVNISSVHARVAEARAIAQCTTKGALEGLTKSTAEALRPYRIRVNAVAPGAIAVDSAGRQSDAPTVRVTQGDIARIVVFLASEQSGSTTGSIIDAFGSTRVVLAEG